MVMHPRRSQGKAIQETSVDDVSAPTLAPKHVALTRQRLKWTIDSCGVTFTAIMKKTLPKLVQTPSPIFEREEQRLQNTMLNPHGEG